jgi:hypothetical protein
MSITASGSGPITTAELDPLEDGVVTYNSDAGGVPFERYASDDPDILSQLFHIR